MSGRKHLNPPTALSAPPQSHSRFAFKRRAASNPSCAEPRCGTPSVLGASAGRGPGSRAPSRKRLGHPASIPRAIMSRSPEALAFGSRRHFIPASLSLPLCGCLLNRSRDCSRSRVPPRFPRRRYADAPAAASFSCLRFASARSRQSPVGERKLDPWGQSPSSPRSILAPLRLFGSCKGCLIHKWSI